MHLGYSIIKIEPSLPPGPQFKGHKLLLITYTYPMFQEQSVFPWTEIIQELESELIHKKTDKEGENK